MILTIILGKNNPHFKDFKIRKIFDFTKCHTFCYPAKSYNNRLPYKASQENCIS
jgi:hypothetical protein